MTDPFTTTAHHTSWLGKLNPGTKFGLIMAISLLLIIVKDPLTPAIILTLETIALLAARFNPFTLLLRYWPLLLAAPISGWATAMLAEKTGPTLLDIGHIHLTTNSVTIGIAMTLRALALTLPSLLFFLTTDPTRWGDSLAQTWKLPARFVLAALAALRLIGLMISEWDTLSMTRRARGVTGSSTATGTLPSLTALASQTFALLVQAIRRGSRLAITMEARGFGSTTTRTWARPDTHTRADAVFAAVALAIPTIAYTISALTGQLTFIWSP